VALVAVCFLLGPFVGFTAVGARVDHYAYDLMTRSARLDEWTPQSVIVAVDEKTLDARRGMRNIRPILKETLEKIAAAQPAAVAIDVNLHDQPDEAEDAQLAGAMATNKKLILSCQLVGGQWEDPAPRFMALAAALGHVHLPPERLDGVSRDISLEVIAGGKQRWAMSLEAFRLARGADLVQSPEDVQVGETLIPAARDGRGRSMLIRFQRAGVPTISAVEIDQHAAELRGKVVFLGVTALSAANDRLVNPLEQDLPGVAIHAAAFETLAHGRFFTRAKESTVAYWCAGFAAAAGLIFALLAGWPAYGLGALLMTAAVATPVLYFRNDVVFPVFAPMLVAWLATAGAASYQHFFVRGQLRRSESEKSRYQQAIHWVAHEMRSPLTTIQGSSEIMTRYKLTDEKRSQLSEMINSESKRMARMIQTFLDIERLADGQMELKREPFAIADVAAACFERVMPLAERKRISISMETPAAATILGDRELMEYAVYNLLTNAVKYSPAETRIEVTFEQRGSELRLAVRDQGIGMDADEVKKIFNKFYRTKRAEASGEAGTGIGLSIVEQIVGHHGGRMEVQSEPGKGSCFTMVLKVHAAASPHAETADRRG
jgi:signal transduction histidine kinase